MVARVLVASPPTGAIGGVAAYTDTLLRSATELHGFNQWWPLTHRSASPAVRLAIHVLGLLRWSTALLTRRPNLVHIQVTSPGIARDLLYVRLAHAMRIPVVCHLHTSGFFGPTVTSSLRHRFRSVVERADAIVVMSRQAAAEIVAEQPSAEAKLHVIPNPAVVDPSFLDAREGVTDRCRFVCVAEINALKGQVDVGTVITRLNAEGVAADLTLVGPRGAIDDTGWTALESNPHVHLVGVRRGKELMRSYAQADAFVLFSRTEAEPLAMLESMAMGLPVIVTAVGSIPDTMRAAGSQNPMVDPTDIEALYEAMRRLAEQPGLRASIGARNAAWARSDRSLEHHLALLRAVHAQVGKA